jgi:hypothetical protein
MQEQPVSFARFALDTAANEGFSFGAGLVCSGIYFTVMSLQKKDTLSKPQIWRNTALVYTITSLAATGVRVLLSKTES